MADDPGLNLNDAVVAFAFCTNAKLLNALLKSVRKSGFDPKTIIVKDWMSLEAWHNVSGLMITCPDNARLEKWLRAWVQKQYEDPTHTRCTDWNSYYRLAVECVGPEGIYVMTDSYSIGD